MELKNNSMKITTLSLFLLTFFYCSSQKADSSSVNHHIGLNWVKLSPELNQGIELEYRAAFEKNIFKSSFGYFGILSPSVTSHRTMSIDDDGLVTDRYSRLNNKMLQVALGIERNVDLSINGQFFIGIDALYAVRMLNNTHSYYVRNLHDDEEISQGIEISDSGQTYRQSLSYHNVGLNLNFGIKFEVTDKITLIPKLTQAYVFNYLGVFNIKDEGEALFNENIVTEPRPILTNNFLYGFAISWRI